MEQLYEKNIPDNRKKIPKNLFFSGAEEARTLYLIAASDALSQVSYDPVPRF